MSRSRERTRVGWVDERRLAAADLRHEAARARRLRSRHVLDVHRTWGVVAGLSPHHGRLDEQVRVDPGLAYDPCGAELVLVRPAQVQLPAEPVDGMTLVIRADRRGCAELAWVPPGGPGLRAGVPLGRLDAAAETVLLDPTAMRRAGSLRRARLRSGSAHLPWSDLGTVFPRLVDIVVGGDTTPRYFVGLDAGRLPDGMTLFATVEPSSEPAVLTLLLVAAFRAGASPTYPSAGGVDVRWMSIETTEMDT